MGEIDTDDFNREQPEQGQPEMEAPELEIELYNDLEQLNLERAKRRFINAMMQGASKKGHYMYHLVPDRIREITGSETLLNDYGLLMSINDSLYWQLSDQMMAGMMGGGGFPGMPQPQRRVTGGSRQKKSKK